MAATHPTISKNTGALIVQPVKIFSKMASGLPLPPVCIKDLLKERKQRAIDGKDSHGHDEHQQKAKYDCRTILQKAFVFFLPAVDTQSQQINNPRSCKNRLLVQKEQPQHSAGSKQVFPGGFLICRLCKSQNTIEQQHRQKRNRLVIITE